jgi:hypothetical protein
MSIFAYRSVLYGLLGALLLPAACSTDHAGSGDGDDDTEETMEPSTGNDAGPGDGAGDGDADGDGAADADGGDGDGDADGGDGDGDADGDGDGDGDSCGGRLGGECADGQFCQYTRDAACGAADIPGTCADKPSLCPDNIAPVCGCDAKTYSNECEAAASSVGVLHDGECDAPRERDCREIPLEDGECWDDGDCGGGNCLGASCCPEENLCIVPDRPGHCD